MNHFGRMNFEGDLIKFWLIPSLQFTFLFYVFGRNNDSKIHKIQKSRPDVPSRNRGYPTVFIIAYMYTVVPYQHKYSADFHNAKFNFRYF